MRIFLLTAALALGLNVSAFGDTPASSPAAIGTHACSDYPDKARINRHQGTTELAFTISDDGTVRNITVSATSGSADLDQAAMECVSSWHYTPAKKEGVAVAVARKTQIVWRVPPLPSPVGFDPQAHRCDEVSASLKMPEGFAETWISFWVEATGSVSQPIVVRSSGDPDMDQALEKCVSLWTYTPAKKNGSAIRIYWGVTFKWTPQTGLAELEEIGRGHLCGRGYYPARELREHVEGDTVLRFQIDTHGDLDQIEVAQSSGNEELDSAGLACAGRWHYHPAAQNGIPIATQWSALISWKDGGAIVAELGPPAPAH